MFIKSDHRIFQLLFLLCFTLTQLACSQPPNVILIMADDMGAECLSVYGGTSYQTPNLDLMAKEGLLVSHCISQPLCTPSRVKLMTGLSNSKNYEYFGYLNTANPTFGHLMKEAGYKTCISGKWQLNGLSYPDQIPDWNDAGRPNQMGFDEYCLWQLTKPRKQGERFANPLIEENGELLERNEHAYGPDIFCNFILEFIEKNRHQPFFAYYPMVLVHDPFVPTPDSKQWENENIRYKQDTAYFGDMMTYADKVVGRIIKKLEEHGLRDNTILIFTADNGTSRRIISHTKNRRVNGAKGMTITDGVHVPLLINWPKEIKSGSIYHGLIEFSDFFPTLAELVGRDVESDGHSFLPLLTKSHFNGRETASVYYDPRWSANVNRYRNSFVQTMSHKLYQDGSFYDLQHDIMEKNPVSKSSLDQADRQVYEQLQNKMNRIPDHQR